MKQVSSDIHTSSLVVTKTKSKEQRLKRAKYSLRAKIKRLEIELERLKKREQSVLIALKKKPQVYKTIFGQDYTLKPPLKYQYK